MSNKTTILNAIFSSTKNVKGKEFCRVNRTISNSGLGKEHTVTSSVLRYINNQIRYANRLVKDGFAPNTIVDFAMMAKKAKSVDVLIPFIWNFKMKGVQETDADSKSRLLTNFSKGIIKSVCEMEGHSFSEYKDVVFTKRELLDVFKFVSSLYMDLSVPQTVRHTSKSGMAVWKKVVPAKKTKTATAK